MLIIYSPLITARLKYTCSFIFKELLGCVYELTTDEESFTGAEGVKINYSHLTHFAQAFTILPQGLLQQAGILIQSVECFEYNGNKAFFKTDSGDFPFDIFAATFYLLSRYEEYLPHTKDSYGRYAHENSLAFKEGFLQQPLINIWAEDLVKTIKEKLASSSIQHSAFTIHNKPFSFLPTYDIDIAYSYKHKGFLRNAGGFFKQPSTTRIKVLLGFEQDPFDTYEWLNQLHAAHQYVQPIYFFLVAEKNGLYDKNILPHHPAMKELIKTHAAKYEIGLHPSWQSGDDEKVLLKEKKLLEAIAGKPITASRQHFIRFNLPHGYQRLIDADITDDYSMGYGSINGFRASVASSFYWYNLQTEQETTLRIHPFCFMEANSFYEQHFTPLQALEEMKYYYDVCKKVNGEFISIWHNHFVGADKMFEGWKEVYEEFMIIRI
jgi:hypothetical protein